MPTIVNRHSVAIYLRYLIKVFKVKTPDLDYQMVRREIHQLMRQSSGSPGLKPLMY